RGPHFFSRALLRGMRPPLAPRRRGQPILYALLGLALRRMSLAAGAGRARADAGRRGLRAPLHHRVDGTARRLRGPPPGHALRRSAICRRSSTKRSVSVWRVASSGARKIEDGCTVAIAIVPAGLDTNSPRRCVTLKLLPRRAWAAVAPRQTMSMGWTSAISVSSHGRQAAISAAFGLAWIRRLPRGSHLKCLTTLVT